MSPTPGKRATNPARDKTHTTDDQTFKKTHQVVGHPETINHSLNDQYFRDPPHNIDPSTTEKERGGNWKVTSDPAAEQSEEQRRPLGVESQKGRIKKADVEYDIIQGEDVDKA